MRAHAMQMRTSKENSCVSGTVHSQSNNWVYSIDVGQKNRAESLLKIALILCGHLADYIFMICLMRLFLVDPASMFLHVYEIAVKMVLSSSKLQIKCTLPLAWCRTTCWEHWIGVFVPSLIFYILKIYTGIYYVCVCVRVSECDV